MVLPILDLFLVLRLFYDGVINFIEHFWYHFVFETVFHFLFKQKFTLYYLILKNDEH